MTNSKTEETAITTPPPPSEDCSRPDEASVPTTEEEVTLDQARKFLQDEHVRTASPERKHSFLRSKGLKDSQITELLGQEVPPANPDAVAHDEQGQRQEKEDDSLLDATPDRAPIITYPEFLSQPTKPPPLLTMSGFFKTIYAFGSLSAMIYGTSKLVLAPMVDSLTDARVELHQSAARNLDKLVEKLEASVSELPPSRRGRQEVDDDDDISYGDPAELFHRDIGVQTSLPSSPLLPPHTSADSSTPQDESLRQAARISRLVTSAKNLGTDITEQSEDYGHVQSLIGVFREELDQIGSKASEQSTGYSFYGSINRNDPDDEIRRAKENIRRLKGMLLSARSFPASTR